MQVNFEKVGFRYRSLIRKIYDFTLNYTKNDFKYAVITVSFANEGKIKELNQQYRKVDKVTDVLSFPMHLDDGANG